MLAVPRYLLSENNCPLADGHRSWKRRQQTRGMRSNLLIPATTVPGAIWVNCALIVLDNLFSLVLRVINFLCFGLH